MWNLATNQQQQVAQHDAPIPCAYISQMNMLVTGSWDKTLKYWDLRSPNPVHTQQLPERVYAMDCTHPLLVVGTADRDILVFNLANPQQVFKQIKSPLKYQTRSVSCFPDATGYLIGSIEGRVAVQHVDDSLQSKNFTFKCHRDGSDVYAVNSMSFHPQHHTFVTAGSEEHIIFGTRIVSSGSKQWPKPMLPFHVDPSIETVLFMGMRCHMIGREEQRSTILLQQRTIFCYMHLQSQRSRGVPGKLGVDNVSVYCNLQSIFVMLYIENFLLISSPC
eukprot:jgi/Picre1/29282/NNA_004674.t1